MALRGTDPESYITECAFVYEDYSNAPGRVWVQGVGVRTSSVSRAASFTLLSRGYGTYKTAKTDFGLDKKVKVREYYKLLSLRSDNLILLPFRSGILYKLFIFRSTEVTAYLFLCGGGVVGAGPS
jgi:hypothetical protein